MLARPLGSKPSSSSMTSCEKPVFALKIKESVQHSDLISFYRLLFSFSLHSDLKVKCAPFR